MFTPSPEALRSVEKRLLASGFLQYEDWPFYQWSSAEDKPLTQEEVDAICTAILADEAAKEQATVPIESKKDKSKGGRPRKGDAKLKGISTLVSPARYDELHAAASAMGVSVSELVRPFVDPVGARAQERVRQILKRGLSQEERKQLRALAGIAANLNQLAKLAHAENYARHATELASLAATIRDLVKSFSE
jgi:hypothetical protein